MEKEQETVTTVSKANKYQPSTLAYVIAVITLGAAFGNMFLAGKIRNVMKAEMPKASWKQSSSQGPNFSSNQYQQQAQQQAYEQNFKNSSSKNHQSRKQQQNYHKEGSNDYDPFAHHTIFDFKSEHLQTLGLTKAQFSENNIKVAYRDLVMKYHPDRIALDDPLRDEYNRKFQQISSSYQILMESIKKAESKKE
jgi:hypothetical protein